MQFILLSGNDWFRNLTNCSAVYILYWTRDTCTATISVLPCNSYPRFLGGLNANNRIVQILLSLKSHLFVNTYSSQTDVKVVLLRMNVRVDSYQSCIFMLQDTVLELSAVSVICQVFRSRTLLVFPASQII